jgi:hypothetical protein
VGKIPGYIDASASADRYVRTVTGRITVGQYQFLLDLAIDWGTDRSAVLRAIINYAAELMPETADGYGEPLGDKVCATARFVTARRLAQEQKAVKDEICRAYSQAMDMSPGSAKDALLKATEEYAKAYSVEWPPHASEIDPIMHDPDLRYVYDRILRLTARNDTSRISLRDLINSTGKDKNYLVSQLGELKQNGHILISEEQRSGQPTIWIEVPTMRVHQ